MRTLLLTTIAETGEAMSLPSVKTMIATIAGTTAFAATIEVEVSFDKTNWISLGNMTVNQGTPVDNFYDESLPLYTYQRLRTHTVSGTISSITVVTG